MQQINIQNITPGMVSLEVGQSKPQKNHGNGQNTTEMIASMFEGYVEGKLQKALMLIEEPDAGSRAAISSLLPGERPLEYKQQMFDYYYRTLEQVAHLFDTVAARERPDLEPVNRIIAELVDLAQRDLDILLNIAQIKHHTDYLYNHSLNVCLLSIGIALNCGYPLEDVREIAFGALFHDIGMVNIPQAIRIADKRLNAEQWQLVQQHPVFGFHIMEMLGEREDSAQLVCYQVHERENGSGYPAQKSSAEIHPYAKIVQVADIYEAESSARSYRNAWIPHDVMTRIQIMAERGYLARKYVDAFVKSVSLYPIGTLIELSSGCIAKVVHANPLAPSTPMAMVLTDPARRKLTPSEMFLVDLQKAPIPRITRGLPLDYLRESHIMEGF
jgi:HD-GYP domain-containing protein (c-di-GMP phosphodiesterase class II)